MYCKMGVVNDNNAVGGGTLAARYRSFLILAPEYPIAVVYVCAALL